MTDVDRFETRLAASLRHLADEAPIEVDAQALTAAISGARPRGWPSDGFFGGIWLRPALRTLLVAATLLALLLAALGVGGLLSRPPIDAIPHGRMACAGQSLSNTTGPVTLDCTTGPADPRLSGSVHLAVGEATPVAGTSLRSGTMEVIGVGTRWVGGIEVVSAPNGAAAGDAVLIGEGAGDGLVLRVRLLSGDGSGWGLLGWIEEAR